VGLSYEPVKAHSTDFQRIVRMFENQRVGRSGHLRQDIALLSGWISSLSVGRLAQ
jgi:hypothetical protein